MEEKLKLTSGLLLLLLLLGTADAALLEGLPTSETETTAMQQNDEDDGRIVLRADDEQPDISKPPAPTGSVRKAQGPDVKEALVSNQFTFTDTKEKLILKKIITNADVVQSQALLRNGDRAGAIAWVSSPNVKKHYLLLKEALHSSFTPDVQDLLDETQRREGHPTRNLLTFYDPGLLPERVVFIRVRERLYEFHVSEGSSEEIFNLIEDLTK